MNIQANILSDKMIMSTDIKYILCKGILNYDNLKFDYDDEKKIYTIKIFCRQKVIDDIYKSLNTIRKKRNTIQLPVNNKNKDKKLYIQNSISLSQLDIDTSNIYCKLDSESD